MTAIAPASPAPSVGHTIVLAAPDDVNASGAAPPSGSPPGSPKKRSISDATSPTPAGTAADAKSPAKKRTKLTDAERQARDEEKRKEKEAKDRKKEAQKAEREEKKKVKDEERRKKDEERRKKEEERRQKEEEKAKKERSQLKLNSFFTPKTTAPSASENTSSTSTTVAVGAAPPSPGASRHLSEYEKTFQPFFVKNNVTVAPYHSFQKDEEYKAAISRTIDEALARHAESADAKRRDEPQTEMRTQKLTQAEVEELFNLPPHKKGPRGLPPKYTTKDILARINAPDDPELPPLTNAGDNEQHDASYYIKLLNSLPSKFLKFAEDVRPPYVGTYTRTPTDRALLRGRNPFKRAIPRIDYDYDSEAEWVADEEGEELLSEDEDEEDLESIDEEMEGFLDDEEDVGLRRRGGIGALVATWSGLCWEDESGKNPRPDFNDMRMGLLLDGVSTPIDPLSTTYWDASAFSKSARGAPQYGAMEPPRRPLMASNRIPGANTAAPADSSKKLVPADQMESFKRAIEGSDMTKMGLVEVLKKQFPKIPKAVIQNTLEVVAVRVGDKREDKRWVLL